MASSAAAAAAPPDAAAGAWGAGLSIPQSEVLIETILGEGKYAQVYKATVYGQDVAVKIPKQDSDRILRLFKAEGQTLSHVAHENVCRWLGYSTTVDSAGREGIMLITEFLPGGNLEDAIVNHKNKRAPLSLFSRLCLARDIVRGMIFVHEHMLVHHDIKPTNIMLDERGRAKIVDFGFARLKPKEPQKDSARGSLLWMAPEVMIHAPYNHKSDVYSWAIILWQLITGTREPYEQYKEPQAFVQDVGHGGVRPPLPDDPEVPQPLLRLLQDSWLADPAARPSFIEILERLQPILVDVACQDEVGRSFWKKNFLTKDAVALKPFLEALFATLQLPLPREPAADARLSDRPLPEKPNSLQLQSAKSTTLREWMKTSSLAYQKGLEEFKRRDALEKLVCFKSILCGEEQKPQMVHLERFGKVLNLFGPISLEDPRQFFEKIRSVLRKPWFHGNVSREQAVAALTTTKPGCFLVRLSTNPLHTAVISLNVGRSVNHIQVNFEVGRGFSLLGKQEYFPGLTELVQHYIIRGPLKEVCPFASPFQYTRTLYDEAHSMCDSGYYLSTDSWMIPNDDTELRDTLRASPDQ